MTTSTCVSLKKELTRVCARSPHLTAPRSTHPSSPSQALVAYFDIEFSHCHKPIRFSTGPHARYTHWKQTVFYLGEVLTVEDGEQINGVIRCRPNARNHRDLDIEIGYELDGRVCKSRTLQPYRLR